MVKITFKKKEKEILKDIDFKDLKLDLEILLKKYKFKYDGEGEDLINGEVDLFFER